jgi:hypothetical protein
MPGLQHTNTKFMMKREQKNYKTTSFWREEDNDIIFFEYVPLLEMDIEVANGIVRDRLDYTKGTSAFALIDFSNIKSVTKEARDYMNSSEGGLKGILGGAFLSRNVVATLFINLYLKINNPTVPAKFFTNRDEALKWLMKVKGERYSSFSNSTYVSS